MPSQSPVGPIDRIHIDDPNPVPQNLGAQSIVFGYNAARTVSTQIYGHARGQ